MAKNPWALPSGFDDTVRKATSSLLKALKNAKRAIPPAALDALRMGNWQAFQELMDWHGIEEDFETFKQILQAQAKNAAVEFYRTGGVGSQLTFDLIDERAVTWASTRAAELVVEITEQMRLNIRNTITSSTLGDMTVQQAAEEIAATLPLTERDALAVNKYYERQVDRLTKTGLSEAKVRTKAKMLRDNYALKLTQSRASTIARTEIASAASQGRLLGWEAGIESGMVDGDSVKEWIAEPTACEICAGMDGRTIPWNEEFPAGMMMPPAHPNCRCSAAILPPDYADSVFTNQAMIKSKVNNFEIEFAKHLSGKHNQKTHAGGHEHIDGKIVVTGLSGYKESSPKDMPVPPKETLTAVRYYAGTSMGMEINEQLRAGKVMFEARKVQEAIDKSPATTKDLVFVRHLGEGAFDELSGIKDKKKWVGEVITNKGFTSMSTIKEDSGQPFFHPFNKLDTQMNVFVPKGARGIRGDAFENEFILSRNSSFVITGVKTVGKELVVDVVLVDQHG